MKLTVAFAAAALAVSRLQALPISDAPALVNSDATHLTGARSDLKLEGGAAVLQAAKRGTDIDLITSRFDHVIAARNVGEHEEDILVQRGITTSSWMKKIAKLETWLEGSSSSSSNPDDMKATWLLKESGSRSNILYDDMAAIKLQLEKEVASLQESADALMPRIQPLERLVRSEEPKLKELKSELERVERQAEHTQLLLEQTLQKLGVDPKELDGHLIQYDDRVFPYVHSLVVAKSRIKELDFKIERVEAVLIPHKEELEPLQRKFNLVWTKKKELNDRLEKGFKAGGLLL